MKKCPVCEKTFDDSMRFCQTDGTPLFDFTETPAEDPLKTTVVRQDEIASSIPPENQFGSVGDSPQSKEDSGDLLQLPEQFDPMKTVVATDEPSFGSSSSEPQQKTPISAPASPFDAFSTPVEPQKPSDYSSAPEPPKFSEPSLSPPNFGDMSTPSSFSDEESKKDEPPPTAIYMPQSSPFSSEQATPNQPASSSPFEKPLDAPIPSPFSDVPKPYENPPVAPYKEPEPPIFSSPQSSPFDQPSPMGQSPFDQQNQGFNQPMQQTDWTPPPAPVSNWQDQGLGANTPFQPPVVTGGQDQTLATVSLVCGILGICLCGIFTGIPAIITGFMAKNNADSNPAQYGGRGMALAGIILGGVSILFTIVAILIRLAN